MKSSGIGGQAVLEGVMMKNKNKYAVAVRKPDGMITVESGNCNSIADRAFIFRLPIIRGVVAFVESMLLGMKTLMTSSDYYEEEDEIAKRSKMTDEEKEKNDKKEAFEMVFTVILSIVLAIGIFMLLPMFLSELLQKMIASKTMLAVIEGLIRIVMFIGYIFAISFMKDIRRVFMYHGAEHKVINCIENGLELTVENARNQSKQHKRCGTSFLFIVMLISVVFFIFLNFSNIWLRFASRILLVPVIAGVSYEFIRIAGNYDNIFINILSKPGLLLQGLTTKEPDDSMLEVAIASVEAVFNWKEYLRRCEAEKKRKEKTALKGRKKRAQIQEEMKQRELENRERAAKRADLIKEQIKLEAEIERMADEAVKRKNAQKLINLQDTNEENDGLDGLNHFLDAEKLEKNDILLENEMR